MKIKLVTCTVIFCLLSLTILHAQKGTSANDEWILSSINLQDNTAKDTLQTVPVFEDASIKCLLNSTWKFSGNGQGFYKIDTENGCTTGVRQITWKRLNIKGSGLFQFSRTSAVQGVPADVNSSYFCEVGSSGKETFALRYPIMYSDKPNTIIFTFTHK